MSVGASPPCRVGSPSDSPTTPAKARVYQLPTNSMCYAAYEPKQRWIAPSRRDSSSEKIAIGTSRSTSLKTLQLLPAHTRHGAGSATPRCPLCPSTKTTTGPNISKLTAPSSGSGLATRRQAIIGGAAAAVAVAAGWRVQASEKADQSNHKVSMPIQSKTEPAKIAASEWLTPGGRCAV